MSSWDCDIVTRTLTVVMDATTSNHAAVVDFLDELGTANVTCYKLSRLPQVGETWEDDRENSCVIESNDGCNSSFPLRLGDETFDSNGSWDGDIFSAHHIVEFVASKKSTKKNKKRLCINAGEYWKDRGGSIHLIDCVSEDDDATYPIVSKGSDGEKTTWTAKGEFSVNHSCHDLDLIQRVNVSPYCE